MSLPMKTTVHGVPSPTRHLHPSQMNAVLRGGVDPRDMVPGTIGQVGMPVNSVGEVLNAPILEDGLAPPHTHALPRMMEINPGVNRIGKRKERVLSAEMSMKINELRALKDRATDDLDRRVRSVNPVQPSKRRKLGYGGGQRFPAQFADKLNEILHDCGEDKPHISDILKEVGVSKKFYYGKILKDPHNQLSGRTPNVLLRTNSKKGLTPLDELYEKGCNGNCTPKCTSVVINRRQVEVWRDRYTRELATQKDRREILVDMMRDANTGLTKKTPCAEFVHSVTGASISTIHRVRKEIKDNPIKEDIIDRPHGLTLFRQQYPPKNKTSEALVQAVRDFIMDEATRPEPRHTHPTQRQPLLRIATYDSMTGYGTALEHFKQNVVHRNMEAILPKAMTLSKSTFRRLVMQVEADEKVKIVFRKKDIMGRM